MSDDRIEVPETSVFVMPGEIKTERFAVKPGDMLDIRIGASDAGDPSGDPATVVLKLFRREGPEA